MIDSLYADIQREARAKIEATHSWGRVQRGWWLTSGTTTFRVCTSCGHSDVFAIAHGLTTCSLTRIHPTVSHCAVPTASTERR